jgi:DNA-binding response OmpR family regulator
MKHVLIVDDALELGRLLQTALTSLEAQLAIAVVPSAEEALLEASRSKIDLLVSDVRLPGMSGMDLVRKIRARHPAMKVIMITGLTEPRVEKEAQEIRADFFLRKPLKVSEFLDDAQACLGVEAGELPGAEKAPGAVKPVDKQVKEPARKTLPQQTPEIKAEEITPAYSETVTTFPTRGSEEQRRKTAPVTAMMGEKRVTGGFTNAVLERLRSILDAQAVLMLEDRGQIVARVGNLPNAQLENQLIPSILAVMGASGLVSHLLSEREADFVQFFHGDYFDMVIRPVDRNILIVVLKPGQTPLRLALALEEIHTLEGNFNSPSASQTTEAPAPPVPAVFSPTPKTIEKIESSQPRMSAPVVQKESEPLQRNFSSEEKGLLDELEKLVVKKGDNVKKEDVESFWADTPDDLENKPSGPDLISFDQASQLGLAPPDLEKPK